MKHDTGNCVRPKKCAKKCIKTKSNKTSKCIIPDCLRVSCPAIGCDSLMDDCDEEDNSVEKMKTHSIECSRVRCKTESAEISTNCETEIDTNCDSSECVSKEEGSNECVTICSSDLENLCDEGEENCSIEKPLLDLKLQRAHKRALCEIRNPYHRRQIKRLAKMRAISIADATSRADILHRLRTSRRDRIKSKKLYNLLLGRLSRFKDNKKSKKMAEYLKKHLGVLNKEKSWKRRQQRSQILTKELARKRSGKSIVRTSEYQMKTIPSYDEKKLLITVPDAELNVG